MIKKYFFSIKKEGFSSRESKFLLYGDVEEHHRIFRLICVQNCDENEIKEIVEDRKYSDMFIGYKVQCVIGEGKDKKTIERWIYLEDNHDKLYPYSIEFPQKEFVKQILRQFESECTD